MMMSAGAGARSTLPTTEWRGRERPQSQAVLLDLLLELAFEGESIAASSAVGEVCIDEDKATVVSHHHAAFIIEFYLDRVCLFLFVFSRVLWWSLPLAKPSPSLASIVSPSCAYVLGRTDEAEIGRSTTTTTTTAREDEQKRSFRAERREVPHARVALLHLTASEERFEPRNLCKVIAQLLFAEFRLLETNDVRFKIVEEGAQCGRQLLHNRA